LGEVFAIFISYCIVTSILQLCQVARGDGFGNVNIFLMITAMAYFVFVIIIQDRNIYEKEKFCIMNPYDSICDGILMCSERIQPGSGRVLIALFHQNFDFATTLFGQKIC